MLDVLPPVTDRTSAEVQQRLGRIRQKLQQQAADAAVGASTITLHADAMPLSQNPRGVSEAIGQHDRLTTAGNSASKSTDPKLKVDFDKTPFWPALDQCWIRPD